MVPPLMQDLETSQFQVSVNKRWRRCVRVLLCSALCECLEHLRALQLNCVHCWHCCTVVWQRVNGCHVVVASRAVLAKRLLAHEADPRSDSVH